jgi:hypothetical protein
MPFTAHAARTQDGPWRSCEGNALTRPGPVRLRPAERLRWRDHMPHAIGPANPRTRPRSRPRPGAGSRAPPAPAPPRHSCRWGCSGWSYASRSRGYMTARRFRSDASGPLRTTAPGVARHHRIGDGMAVSDQREASQTGTSTVIADIIDPAHAMRTCITTMRVPVTRGSLDAAGRITP